MIARWWATLWRWWHGPLLARIADLEAELAETRVLVDRLYQMPHNHWVPTRGWFAPPSLESGFTITPHVGIGRGTR